MRSHSSVKLLRRQHLTKPPLRWIARPLVRGGVIPFERIAGANMDTTFRLRVNGCAARYRVEPGDWYGQALYWRGLHYGHAMRLWLEWAKESHAILDVGAHTGVFSLLAADVSDATITAVEPIPVTYRRLTRNIEINGAQGRIRCLQVAAGSADGELPIHLNDDLTMCSLASQYGDGAPTPVPVRRLDDVVTNADLIKIDVEGWQHEALAGMPRLLACRPRLIFECNPGDRAETVEGILRDHGYRLFHIGSERLEPVGKLDPDKHTTHDFVAQ